MNGALQNRINPPVASSNQHSFSTAKVKDQTAVEKNTDANADFDRILANSNEDIRQRREAIRNGDLSAESKDEFFEKLAQQTEQKKANKNQLKKDDFLKLFVSQLQHQDPLKPKKGAEMASDLAQFNSLEQMMNVNKTLEKLVDAQGTGRNLQLVNYVGKEVVIEGGRINLNNDQVSQSTYHVKRPVTESTLIVRDSSGAKVFKQDLGPLAEGSHNFHWEGVNNKNESLPDGIYSYSIEAKDIEGNNVPIDITSKAEITGVDLQSEKGKLYSAFGELTFDEIKSVGEPGFNRRNATTSMQDELQRRQATGELPPNRPIDWDEAKAREAFAKRKAARSDASAPPPNQAQAPTASPETPVAPGDGDESTTPPATAKSGQAEFNQTSETAPSGTQEQKTAAAKPASTPETKPAEPAATGKEPKAS
jgi:flagellar basal-body rod modification protein FlgD